MSDSERKVRRAGSDSPVRPSLERSKFLRDGCSFDLLKGRTEREVVSNGVLPSLSGFSEPRPSSLESVVDLKEGERERERGQVASSALDNENEGVRKERTSVSKEAYLSESQLFLTGERKEVGLVTRSEGEQGRRRQRRERTEKKEARA